MKRYLLIGLLVFLIAAIAMVPAGLVARALQSVPNTELIDPRGRIWQGQGQLLLQGNPVGILRWSVDALDTMLLSPSARWQLDQTFIEVSGDVQYSNDGLAISADGDVRADAVNPALQPYQLSMTGDFEIDGVELGFDTDSRQISQASGEIYWSGGLVRFTMAGRLREERLPPLIMRLTMSDGPQAVVYATDDPTPLLIVSQGLPGFVKYGVTKQFTRLLGQPWPGSAPNHQVVIELEEQIFD